MAARLLADCLLVIHSAFVAFVVGGQALVLVGWWRKWRWVRGMTFRSLHLVAIVIVAAQSVLGAACPLTIWEIDLRVAAGQEPYESGFIAHWLQALCFFEAPRELFTFGYGLFGLLVLLSWFGCPPQRTPKRSRLGNLPTRDRQL